MIKESEVTTGVQTLDTLLGIPEAEAEQVLAITQAYKNFCRLACANVVGDQISGYGSVQHYLERVLERINLSESYGDALKFEKEIDKLYKFLISFIHNRNNAGVLEDVETVYVDKAIVDKTEHKGAVSGYISVNPDSLKPTEIPWIIMNQADIESRRTLTPKVQAEFYSRTRELTDGERDNVVTLIQNFLNALNEARNKALAIISDASSKNLIEDGIFGADQNPSAQIKLISI